MPPRYPVFWITLLTYVAVVQCAQNASLGFIIAAYLLAALCGQFAVRWLLRRMNARVWIRRTVMLVPSLILAAYLFSQTNAFGGFDRRNVKFALAGQLPNRIQNLHVYNDTWTDVVVVAYFRCDPASLRQILERLPFARSSPGFAPATLSFQQTPIPELKTLPDVANPILYRRVDMEGLSGSCEVYTDATFSFVYLEFGED